MVMAFSNADENASMVNLSALLSFLAEREMNHVMIESGPNARTVQINLNPFTLVGATTRSGLLTAPMRARFGIASRFYISVPLWR